MALIFDEARHRYTLDGEKVPGVTTIIGKGLPKPGLPYWAANTVAQYAVDHPGASYGELRRSPWAERDRAAVRGTEVHAYAEKALHGDEVDVPAILAPYVQGAVDLMDELGVEPIHTEVQLASRAHWYAGTADLFAHVGEEVWLLDWKTSKSIHGSYFAQLGAYAAADFLLVDGEEIPVPHVDRIAAVHLTTEGAFLYPGPPVEDAWLAFSHIKAVADRITTIDSWSKK